MNSLLLLLEWNLYRKKSYTVFKNHYKSLTSERSERVKYFSRQNSTLKVKMIWAQKFKLHKITKMSHLNFRAKNIRIVYVEFWRENSNSSLARLKIKKKIVLINETFSFEF